MRYIYRKKHKLLFPVRLVLIESLLLLTLKFILKEDKDPIMLMFISAVNTEREAPPPRQIIQY